MKKLPEVYFCRSQFPMSYCNNISLSSNTYVSTITTRSASQNQNQHYIEAYTVYNITSWSNDNIIGRRDKNTSPIHI